MNRKKGRGPYSVATAIFCETLCKPRAKGPTKRELIEITGCSENTIAQWLALFESKQLIYISGWKRIHNGHIPEWSWGYKMYSVPKPLPLTSKEIGHRYRLRKRIAKENHDTKYHNGITSR